MIYRLLIVLGFLFTNFLAYCQTDSLQIDSTSLYPLWQVAEPTRAALLSAAVPGLGQIHNRKLWYIEIPIIYGTGAILGYVISQNHKRYVEFRDALLYTLDNNDLTVPDYKFLGYDTDRLLEVRDRYRRERDYYIILSAVAYLLNIAEAATVAHLKTFDVSDDLNVRLEPFVDKNQFNATSVGVSLKFYIQPKKYVSY